MKNFLKLFGLAFVLLQGPGYAIDNFSTDGCSMYPDGVPMVEANKWFHCCFTHDMAYWVGGKKAEKVAADRELNNCVSRATFSLHGKVMEIGVAAGGIPDTPLPWRWAYGFNEDRSYKNMSFEEKQEAFEKFDGILDTIEEWKDLLTYEQKGYMLSRYELLRHELSSQIHLTHDIETKTFDQRLLQVERILKTKR